MEIPPGFETPATTNKVCKLKKSLYGLKQSPRAWFDKFTRAVKKFGYDQCQTDHTMFVKHSSSGKKAILIVYVDDIILTGDHDEEILKLKRFLAKEFEIKDLGNLKHFSWHVSSSVKKRYFSFPAEVCVGPLGRNMDAWM